MMQRAASPPVGAQFSIVMPGNWAAAAAAVTTHSPPTVIPAIPAARPDHRRVRPDDGLEPLVEDVVAAECVRDADEAGEHRADRQNNQRKRHRSGAS